MSCSSKSRFRTLFSIGRLALGIVILLSIVIVLSWNAAVAKADEQLLQIGRHLLQMPEGATGSDSRNVLFNGQNLRFQTSVVDGEMEAILDFYESWCRTGDSDFLEYEPTVEFLRETSLVSSEDDHDTSWRDLTRRHSDDDVGFVACMKHGIENATNEQLVERFVAFVDGENLKDLGSFHYVATTRLGERTRVVAVWTDGDFYPFQLFPETGDAPGTDVPGIPRPPNSRRVLSAGEMGFNETLTVYLASNTSRAELESYYRTALPLHGWRILENDSSVAEDHLFLMQRGGDFVALSIDEEDGKTSITIASTD